MKILKLAVVFCFFVALGACKNDKTDQKQLAKTGIVAIDSLTERIASSPTDPQLYFRRAQAFYEHGEQGGYDQAIVDMQYALVLDSTNIDFHHFLADVYMDYKQSRLGVTTMERAAALAPERVPTQLKLSEFYLITKQYGAAFGAVDRILKRDPQNAEAYFMLGMIAKEKGEEPSAMSAFQKAVDLDASNKDAFIELGNLYAAKGNKLALKYFDNALLIDSLDDQAAMGKAYFLQTQNKTAEAIAIYQDVIRRDVQNEGAFFNLGLLYLEKNDLDKAAIHFDLVVQQSPTYFKAYFYRGYIKEKKGDKTGALADFKQALEFKSDYDKALEGVKRLEK
jgi:tetratricopeptide (TPR) repeat protein